MAMNGSLLIDAIVRQTVVLIATLATGAGQRASLSHVADQVFSDLVRALKEQGLSNKLIADMFGMALRTYHSRVAQLSESRTDTGRSLWEAVYDHIQRRAQASFPSLSRARRSSSTRTKERMRRRYSERGNRARWARGSGAWRIPELCGARHLALGSTAPDVCVRERS